VAQPEEEGAKEEFNFPFIPVDLTFEDICYEVKASTGDGTLQLLNNVCGVLRGGRMCALMGSSGAGACGKGRINVDISDIYDATLLTVFFPDFFPNPLGKTTLMDVVSLRKTSGTITGDVRLNGFPQERTSFLRSSGYVEQFDVQQGELSVYETIVFSARLRLSRDNPVTATDEGRLKFVDFVMETMELTNIKNTQVGNYEGRLDIQVWRKRTSYSCLTRVPFILLLQRVG